jgi:hypothetical protein
VYKTLLAASVASAKRKTIIQAMIPATITGIEPLMEIEYSNELDAVFQAPQL